MTTTSTIPGPVRSVDSSQPVRVLPGPTDPVWADPMAVWAIAAYTDRTVDPGAHTLAHPVPQPGCPFGGCPTGTRPYRDRSSETVWRADALVSPVPAEPAVTW